MMCSSRPRWRRRTTRSNSGTARRPCSPGPVSAQTVRRDAGSSRFCVPFGALHARAACDAPMRTGSGCGGARWPDRRGADSPRRGSAEHRCATWCHRRRRRPRARSARPPGLPPRAAVPVFACRTEATARAPPVAGFSAQRRHCAPRGRRRRRTAVRSSPAGARMSRRHHRLSAGPELRRGVRGVRRRLRSLHDVMHVRRVLAPEVGRTRRRPAPEATLLGKDSASESNQPRVAPSRAARRGSDPHGVRASPAAGARRCSRPVCPFRLPQFLGCRYPTPSQTLRLRDSADVVLLGR